MRFAQTILSHAVIASRFKWQNSVLRKKTERESVEYASNHFQTRHYTKSYIIHTAFMHACIIIIYRLMKIVVLTTYSICMRRPLYGVSPDGEISVP